MIRKFQFFFIAFFCVFLLKAQPTKQFTSGEIWKDNNGKHINAHGGGILF